MHIPTSKTSLTAIQPVAPSCDEFTDYDAAHMLTYARLLDAERAGHGWEAAAREILLLDVEGDVEAAERCWRSHYDRALWSISTLGLEAAARANIYGWFTPADLGPDPSDRGTRPSSL